MRETHKSEYEIIESGNLQDCIDYNSDYDRSDTMRGSEATKFDLGAMKIWFSVRDKLTKTDDASANGNWRTLPITQTRTKYGTCYVFIDIDGKKWRWRESGSEFYGYRPPMFDPNELK